MYNRTNPADHDLFIPQYFQDFHNKTAYFRRDKDRLQMSVILGRVGAWAGLIQHRNRLVIQTQQMAYVSK